AVSADQHQGANRIAGCLVNVGGRDFAAGDLRLGLDTLADRLADLDPLAVECRDKLAALDRRPVRPAPARAIRVATRVAAIVPQALEERPPFRVDRLRVGREAGM